MPDLARGLVACNLNRCGSADYQPYHTDADPWTGNLRDK